MRTRLITTFFFPDARAKSVRLPVRPSARASVRPHVRPHVLAALRIGGGRTAGRLPICTRRQLLTIWYGRTAGRLPVRGFWRQLLTISVAALLADLLTVKPTRGDVGSNDKLTKRCIRTTKYTTQRRSIDWWWPHCWPTSNLH